MQASNEQSPMPVPQALPPAVKSARGYVIVSNVPKGATSDNITRFFEGYGALRAGISVVKNSLQSSTWTVVVQFKSRSSGEDAVVRVPHLSADVRRLDPPDAACVPQHIFCVRAARARACVRVCVCCVGSPFSPPE